MYYAVIQRPEIDTTDILKISKKYDPTFGVVGPHITLLFPVSSKSINEDTVEKHVKKVAQETSSFRVHMVDLELAWDQWLFLTPKTPLRSRAP
jgi:2'-5' RNA ligase